MRALEDVLAAEVAAGDTFDLVLLGITDGSCELVGYRLFTPGRDQRKSRLYLSRQDALDAWINRCIEWET